MEIIHIKMNEPYSGGPIAACIGHFDGVHLGHQALIFDTIRNAAALNVASAMITFDPDPLTVIKGRVEEFISGLDIRLKLAAHYGLDKVIILHFDCEMSRLSKDAFIRDILNRLSIRVLTCGFDYRFGHCGEGGVDDLRETKLANFKVSVIEPILWHERKISSTWIIEAIKTGDIATANGLLGHPFSLCGSVMKGHQIGRKLDFPTANIDFEIGQVLPKEGVYIGEVSIDGEKFEAMINIGKNPTFYHQHPVTIEAHILDFEKDIYGQRIEITFLAFLRNERRFPSADALVEQLQRDIAATSAYFMGNVCDK